MCAKPPSCYANPKTPFFSLLLPDLSNPHSSDPTHVRTHARTHAMSDDEDFSALESRVFASVVSTVRAVTALGAHDIPFQRSSDADFAGAADDTAARILALANALLAGAAPARIAPLGSEDDVEQRWGDVVDVTDHLLERADVCLDEASGAIKPPPVRPLPAAAASKVGMQLYNSPRRRLTGDERQPRAAAFRTSVNSWATRNMAKPQLAFAIKPDNVTASDEPFRPLLTVKPHASVPLAESLHAAPNEAGRPQYVTTYCPPEMGSRASQPASTDGRRQVHPSVRG